jgi:Flp pilus assembly protein protease CpaA
MILFTAAMVCAAVIDVLKMTFPDRTTLALLVGSPITLTTARSIPLI